MDVVVGIERTGAPSSRITLSPKTLTSMVPLDLSTMRIRISLMARDLALMSIAQTPKTTGARVCKGPTSWKASDPMEEGDDERVRRELERGDGRSGELKKCEIRD